MTTQPRIATKHRAPLRGLRRDEPADRLPRQASGHEEEDERVRHRGDDCRPAKAEGASLRRLEAGERRRPPRETEAKDVPEVVPRVSQQRDGVRDDAIHDLDDDEREVQPDAESERATVANRPVGVAVVMAVIMVVVAVLATRPARLVVAVSFAIVRLVVVRLAMGLRTVRLVVVILVLMTMVVLV